MNHLEGKILTNDLWVRIVKWLYIYQIRQVFPLQIFPHTVLLVTVLLGSIGVQLLNLDPQNLQL